METHQISYRNIYFNESETKRIIKKLKYYKSIGFSDCEIEIDENGKEFPRNCNEGAYSYDYCVQIHKVINPTNQG